jgi:hypothetical protein
VTRVLSPVRLAVAGLAVLGLVADLLIGSAFGGLQARVDNTADNAASGTLLYSHSYSGGPCTSVPSGTITNSQSVNCAGSLYPATAAAAKTDSITANGTLPSSGVTQTVRAASCGAVQLANRIDATHPMLARYGTTFGAAGPMTGSAAITLDGAGPGGYESAVVSQPQPTGPAIIGSASYGLGIWFKTSSTTGGPLFGFGSSASNIAGTQDRILYLTAAGKIGFIAAGTASTPVSSTSYNNGGWHFAYVRIDTTRIVVGLSYTVTVFVDGVSATSGSSGLLGALNSYAGYWHLGWSPVSGLPSYLAGSLSNFVVLNNGSAPTSLAVVTTQTAFDTNTASASEHWRLDDAGTVTASVSLPVINANAPCSYVDIQWGFTNPLSCAAGPASTTSACTVANTTLSAFVTSGAQTVSSAAPGTTQTSTITLAHDATYTGAAITNFLSGLMIYAPLTIKMAVGATPWSTAFTWADPPGSTFLL